MTLLSRFPTLSRSAGLDKGEIYTGTAPRSRRRTHATPAAKHTGSSAGGDADPRAHGRRRVHPATWRSRIERPTREPSWRLPPTVRSLDFDRRTGGVRGQRRTPRAPRV